MEQNIKSNNFETYNFKNNKFLVIRLSLTSTLYAIMKEKEVIGAVQTNIIGIENKAYDEISLSKKYIYNKETKGLSKKIFEFIHYDQKRDIISADEHSTDSIALWYSILKNNSLGEEVIAVDIKGNKLKIPPKIKNQIWVRDNAFKNKRVIIKF